MDDLRHASAAPVKHIFVGDGDGPCMILMAGARSEDDEVHYPVSELAAHFGASMDEATFDPEQAHAQFERPRREKASNWEPLPWA